MLQIDESTHMIRVTLIQGMRKYGELARTSLTRDDVKFWSSRAYAVVDEARWVWGHDFAKRLLQAYDLALEGKVVAEEAADV